MSPAAASVTAGRLLRHGTDAEIDAYYVDTHGGSLVGFAFCELLNFELLPRLENIGSIRLYRPNDNPHLLTRSPTSSADRSVGT